MLQRGKAISDKMTGGKMTAEKKQVVCTFYNSGYCRYKGDCKYNHPKENCQISYCKNKMCTKRHPKECRFGNKCRRKSLCLYKHDHSSTPSSTPSNSESPVIEVEETEVNKLKAEVEALKMENKEKREGVQKLANEIENIKKKGDDKDKTIVENMLKDKESLKDEIKALKGFMKSLQLENSSNKAKILELEKDLNNVKENLDSKTVKVKEKAMKNADTTNKKVDEKVVEPGNTRFEWTQAMKEFRKCRRCGKEFEENNDMIIHMKNEHVNFVKSVQTGLQTMAIKKKNPKTPDQQRECDYFEALAVQLNTADVC